MTCILPNEDRFVDFVYTGEFGLVKMRNLAFLMQFISSGLTSLS